MTTFDSFFFFQAEDGIRDFHVTGVQTCALPIYAGSVVCPGQYSENSFMVNSLARLQTTLPAWALRRVGQRFSPAFRVEIGRASCRERVEIWGVCVTREKKESSV